jgi:ornithine cyclodeaminase/alanine dehydrogenase-like protein (mu-crystallin family)
MLRVTEQQVREHLPVREAIRVLREAFTRLHEGRSLNQPRRRLAVPGGAILHSMAGADGRYFGTKVYSTHPKHGAHFWFHLYDAETARPLALFEANYLGQIRTGAASGVATDLLSPATAETVAVIGTGFQARSQLEAVLEVRPARQVRAWSRKAANRERFARECSERFGVEVRAASSAREAVEGAAIVVTATYARDPVIDSEWVQSGTHINAIGSNNPARRELPPALLDHAGLIVVDSLEQAAIESGDMLLAAPREDWRRWPLRELPEIVATGSGRADPAQTTIFNSLGLGVEDVAVAGYVYERIVTPASGSDDPSPARPKS